MATNKDTRLVKPSTGVVPILKKGGSHTVETKRIPRKAKHGDKECM